MRKNTVEEFVQKAKEIHGDKYDYSLVDYKNALTKVKIICPKHGVFEQTPNKHLLGRNCPSCSKKKPWTTEEFVQKAKEVHGDKYDYSLVEVHGILNKVKIICPKHGVFEQIAQSHINGSGCKKCLSCIETFLQKAKEVHGDKYDYSLVDYKNMKTKVKIICPKHGVFEQMPYSHILDKHGCPKCKNSKGELVIFEWLSKNIKNKFLTEFRFRDCKDEQPLPFDFYIPSKNLLIEFQGEQHYRRPENYWNGNAGLKKQRHHDWLKRKYAKDMGINLLIIPYWEINNINAILEKTIRGKEE